MKRPMGSAQLFSVLRGPNHVMGSVGNRIENITGNMAGALLSLHQLDLRTLSAVYSQYSTHSLGLLSFLRVRKEKSQPSISSGFLKGILLLSGTLLQSSDSNHAGRCLSRLVCCQLQPAHLLMEMHSTLKITTVYKGTFLLFNMSQEVVNLRMIKNLKLFIQFSKFSN